MIVGAVGTLFNVTVIGLEGGLVHKVVPTVKIHVAVRVNVPVPVNVIEGLVSPLDHFKSPVEHPLCKMADAPQTLPFPPPLRIIVGAEGVFKTVAVTVERFTITVSQPAALLQPTVYEALATRFGAA